MRRSSVVLVFVSVLAVTRASAQTSYQPYVLGLRTAGMGGAGTAAGSDSAAPWLNPAGLVLGGTRLALSANAALVRQSAVADFFSIAPGSPLASSASPSSSERTSSDLSVFPTSVVYALPLDAAGDHVLAFSVITPYQAALDELTSFVLERGGSPSLTQLDQRIERLAMHDFGFSYATRVDTLRLGASVFLRHSQLESNGAGDTIAYDATAGKVGFSHGASTASADALDVDLILGVQAGPFAGFSVGASVRGPSITSSAPTARRRGPSSRTARPERSSSATARCATAATTRGSPCPSARGSPGRARARSRSPSTSPTTSARAGSPRTRAVSSIAR